jgi:hypothetical protein
MRIVRVACWLALLGGVVLFSLNGARAQGSPEAQQACTPDAMRLCSDAIPDVPKVTACMKAKYSQLSEACRLAMRGGSATGTAKHVTHEVTHHHRRAARASRCDPFTHLCS